MKLFICHASEDKDDFVRLLATELRRKHEVWYDEWVLVVGDSLLQKINEGLRTCDFAVVVLSPSFFKKKWPQNELGGLLALEQETRKIILPVWKDLSAEQVSFHSAIIAGRMAAQASEGPEKVAHALQIAIDSSSRTREIDGSNPVITEGRLLNAKLEDRRIAEQLSHTEEGTRLVLDSITHLYDSCARIGNELRGELGISLSRTTDFDDRQPAFVIRTRQGWVLELELWGLGLNFTHETWLHARLFNISGRNIQTTQGPIAEWKFTPTFRLRAAVWKDGKRNHSSAEQLAQYLIGLLLERIKRDLDAAA